MELSPFDFKQKLTDIDKNTLNNIVHSKGLKINIYTDKFFPQNRDMKIAKALNSIFNYGNCSATSWFYDSKVDCNNSVFNYIINTNNIQEQVKDFVLPRIRSSVNIYLYDIIKESDNKGWKLDSLISDYENKLRSYIEFVLNNLLENYGLFDAQIYTLATYNNANIAMNYGNNHLHPYAAEIIRTYALNEENRIKNEIMNQNINQTAIMSNELNSNNNYINSELVIDDMTQQEMVGENNLKLEIQQEGEIINSEKNLIQIYQQMFKERDEIIKNQQMEINKLKMAINDILTNINGLSDRHDRLAKKLESEVKSLEQSIRRSR